MLKSSPDKIIAQGTDWRFLAEMQARPLGRGHRGLVCPLHQAGGSPGSSEA